MLQHFTRPGDESGPHPELERLTQREQDVVREVARGLTNTEIAGALFLSLSTVKTHLASVQNKIGARNRVEIASWAWRTGLVTA
jgi:DNA-binding NarL/FixJ family response regulator